MVDLAKQAFQTKNFDLAVEIYERTIKENGPSSRLFLGLADSCAKTGQVLKALDAYKVAFRLGPIKPEQLNHLVASLIDTMGENKDFLKSLETNKDEVFACGICKSLLIEPVTITCGHTFCRTCLEKENSQICKQCDVVCKYRRNILQRKTNVVLQNIIEKWFSQELQAVRLKKRGNDLFKKQQMKDAIIVYSEAMKFAPMDHLVAGNRSHAYANLESFSEALNDAELAVKLRPDWAKGYFRKGTALNGLNKHEEACYAFLQCLTLDPSVSSAKSALAKSLHKVLSPLPPENLKQAELQAGLSPVLSELMGYTHPSAGCQTDAVNGNKFSHDALEQLKISLQEQAARPDLVCKTDAKPNSFSSLEDMSTSAIDSDEAFKYPSLPPCGAGSPLTIHRRSSSDTELQLLGRTHSRKRVCQSPKEPMSPTRVCPAKHAKGETDKSTVTRHIPSPLLNQEDFDCTLCYRMFYQPITTPCGHTFCKQCLDRCMDHSSNCPLCKSSLVEYIASRDQAVTQVIEEVLEKYFPSEFQERKLQFEEDMAELAEMGEDRQQDVPIFVCTLAFPRVTCPLHIFEPRYRLMIRRCMESGTRQFGMCCCPDGEEQNFSSIGTMLEIRDVQYLADGRSVVDTIGGRPFRVLSRGRKDGYNTARIEFLTDAAVADNEQQELLVFHNEMHREAISWFDTLPLFRRTQIEEHFGPIPNVEQNPLSLTNGPAWCWWMVTVLPLDPRVQLTILAMTSLRDRLVALRRVLTHFKKKQIH